MDQVTHQYTLCVERSLSTFLNLHPGGSPVKREIKGAAQAQRLGFLLFRNTETKHLKHIPIGVSNFNPPRPLI